MAGPGDGRAPWAVGDHGRMRASHADREQVIMLLKAAFVQGRLDKSEFDLRVGHTFASRTYADLAGVTADLPAELADAQPAGSARAKGGRPGRIATIATMVYAGGWLAFLLWAGSDEPTAAVVMAYLGTLIYLGVLAVVAAAALETRHDRPSRQLRRGPGPGPGGQAPPPLRPASPRTHYRPAAPGHRHAAQAARLHRPRPPRPARGHNLGRPVRLWPTPASG
jgi:Domain of unknown function (DUF1707)